MTKENQKTIKPKWSVLCHKTSIDKDSNSLSIFNVLEQLTLSPKDWENLSKDEKGNKVILVYFELVTLWEHNPQKKEQREIKVTLLDPHGEKIFEQPFPLHLEKSKTGLRQRLQFRGLPVTDAGEYLFKISLKKEEKYQKVSEISFNLKTKRQSED